MSPKVSKGVVGYIRVSTQDQADNGGGLDAQRKAIEDECSRRGWKLAAIFEDAGYSVKTVGWRPQLQAALASLRAGEADGLVVAKLDRLTRSTADMAILIEQFQKHRWALIVLDFALDTSTPTGELVANVLASFAEFERRMIGLRTREGMAAKKAAGTLKGPVGRSRGISGAVERWMVAVRKRGATYAQIAVALTSAGVPTAQGGRIWYPSVVRVALSRYGYPSPARGVRLASLPPPPAVRPPLG